MENSYPVRAESLVSKLPHRFAEGWFSSWVAGLEKYFKKLVQRENLRCPRCGLIVGNEFCLGVRIPEKVEGQFVFFAAHPSCMDGTIIRDCNPDDGKGIIVSIGDFLELEKEILSAKASFDKEFNRIAVKNVNGKWRVFLGLNNG